MQTTFLIILIALLGAVGYNQLQNFTLLADSVSANKVLSEEMENLDQAQVILSAAVDLGAVARLSGSTCPANTQRWTHTTGFFICIPRDSLCSTSSSNKVPCVISSMAAQTSWQTAMTPWFISSAEAQTVPTLRMMVPTCSSSDPDCVNCGSAGVTCVTIPMCRIHSNNCPSQERFLQTIALPVPKSAVGL